MYELTEHDDHNFTFTVLDFQLGYPAIPSQIYRNLLEELQ